MLLNFPTIYKKSSFTGFSPFELANGQQPLTPYEVARQKSGGSCPTTYRFVRTKQKILEEARDSLNKVAKRMKKNALLIDLLKHG